MNKSDITIGVMGSNQFEHIISVLKQSGYKIVRIQDIWDSDEDKKIKEEKYRKAIQDCDVLYNVYSGNFFWAKASYAKLIGKKVITHWIGTDVLNAINGDTGYIGHSIIDYNFVCFEVLQKELKTIGIETSVLPIVPFNMDLNISEMPEEHAVMIYMPEDRLEHYGYNEFCYIFEKFSNLIFHIVANREPDSFKKYKNVIVHGWLNADEMNELYNKVSIVIRFVKHDGLSMSVIEGLVKGKKVIWNNPYYGVVYAENKEVICTELEKIIKEPPVADVGVSEYVRDMLSIENFNRAFDEAVEKIFR